MSVSDQWSGEKDSSIYWESFYATRPKEFDINNVTYPLYAMYLKMFLMLVATILMVPDLLAVIVCLLSTFYLQILCIF